jgi:hypothetical protein
MKNVTISMYHIVHSIRSRHEILIDTNDRTTSSSHPTVPKYQHEKKTFH